MLRVDVFEIVVVDENSIIVHSGCEFIEHSSADRDRARCTFVRDEIVKNRLDRASWRSNRRHPFTAHSNFIRQVLARRKSPKAAEEGLCFTGREGFADLRSTRFLQSSAYRPRQRPIRCPAFSQALAKGEEDITPDINKL